MRYEAENNGLGEWQVIDAHHAIHAVCIHEGDAKRIAACLNVCEGLTLNHILRMGGGWVANQLITIAIEDRK